MLAHIAGVPVEEGALALGPAALGLAAILAAQVRARIATRTRWGSGRDERSDGHGAPGRHR